VLRERIAAYLFENGFPAGEAVREEVGVLPVAIGGDIGALLGAEGGAARIGMRGGFFHPTTGYSLPDAVRLAGLIAAQPGFGALGASGRSGSAAGCGGGGNFTGCSTRCCFMLPGRLSATRCWSGSMAVGRR
jgi:hypothetical protein